MSVVASDVEQRQSQDVSDVSGTTSTRASVQRRPTPDLGSHSSRSTTSAPNDRKPWFGIEPFSPPTVSETKTRFAGLHTSPIPAVYSTVVLELLVQHHFMRYNKKYRYDPIFALGFVSAFDQILEGFDAPSKDDIFSAYLKSLDENPVAFRQDAANLESACQELNGNLDDLLSQENSNSNLLKSSLSRIAENAKNGEFYYTKFFAIGLFRVLELTGFKDPKALERLVSVVNGNLEFVNRDLKLYKNILTRLSAAKEMMKEVTEREQKRSAEREASKVMKDESKESEGTDVSESQQT